MTPIFSLLRSRTSGSKTLAGRSEHSKTTSLSGTLGAYGGALVVLWRCSAFKPSSLNKINCGDAGLAICSVTMGGRREGVERSKSQVPCTPLPRLVHMKYLAVVTGSHCDFIGGLVRRSEPVLLQYSDCHLSSTSRWDCFSCLPSHHWYISVLRRPAGC